MKRIAALGFPQSQLLDLTGPLQVFASANRALGREAYQIQLLGMDEQFIETNSGVRLVPDHRYADVTQLDTLILAGGSGVYPLRKDRDLIAWLQQIAPLVRRITSVCTGAFLLAEAGLLQNKRVVTHWRACSRLQEEYGVEVEQDAIWLKQGKLYTSAGVTSGIDLALALVEEDFGHAIAMSVARELVVFMKRPGGQNQFSLQLQAQNRATGVVANAIEYIEQNLAADLNLSDLAEQVHVSERHLFRLFKQSQGCSPAAYIESCRLTLSQQLLCEEKLSIKQVAERSGFVSADNLRRVFQRRLGVSARDYCERFGPVNTQPGSDAEEGASSKL